ncbi:MAG TPA: DUF6570 domain-containing protein, partial [Nitrososphaeraceae archaeon]|nr:DUF6570 domain-containing protein [Nitrososphaeraceae archaeon]
MGDIELYDIVPFYVGNKTICNNDHDLHGHSLSCSLSPYKLNVYEQATFLNDRYHVVIDIAAKPKHICLLLTLLFLRTILRKHDYLIMQYHIRYWTTMFPCFKRHKKRSSLTTEEHYIGGGVSELFSLAQLQPYLLKDSIMIKPSADLMYKFEGYHIKTKQVKEDVVDQNTLLCDIPLCKLLTNLTILNLKLVAAAHGIFIKSRTPLPEVIKLIQGHACDHCQNFIAVFKPAKSLVSRRREANMRAVRKYRTNKICLNNNIPLATDNIQHYKRLEQSPDPLQDKQTFPPPPLEWKIEHSIVKAWCKDMSPKNFEEVGCAVCGELSLRSKSVLLKDASINLDILQCYYNVTRKERKTEYDPVTCLDGPVIDPNLQYMCARCNKSMTSGKVPKFSLANGMWLGQVPSELADLTFAEQLLIARVCHNRCLVRVSSGWHKMTAN